VGAQENEKTWIGTLASGLASGVLTPLLCFEELRAFLEKTFLVKRLLTKAGEAREDALANARQSAWIRSCRTFRGVPNLNTAGCCSLKDRIYLQGYLEILDYLERGDEQRLLVGKIGVSHLGDMAELNILVPSYPHRHLALAPDLLEQVSWYEK
jgi:hypothetical protein